MSLISVGKSARWGWQLKVGGVGIPYICIPTEASRLWKKRFSGLNKRELKICLEAMYETDLGKKVDLDHPVTFTEKQNWIKIYYRNPLMHICADKVKGRDYVMEKLPGREDILVHQLGVYKRWEDIDFDSFPNRFVLKSNWGSGAQIIVKDKSAFDPRSVRAKVNKWMDPRSNHYYSYFETGYKDIEPWIVAEEFLDFEYKLEFFCFNGCPKFFWIVTDDKTKNTKANFYNLDWTRIPVVNHYPNFEAEFSKPEKFDEMLGMAKTLCGDFPFMRCDFYVTRGGFRFSEMTFFHWGSMCGFSPSEYDKIFGDMMQLPK